jgi:hypothetical protein
LARFAESIAMSGRKANWVVGRNRGFASSFRFYACRLDDWPPFLDLLSEADHLQATLFRKINGPSAQ